VVRRVGTTSSRSTRVRGAIRAEEDAAAARRRALGSSPDPARGGRRAPRTRATPGGFPASRGAPSPSSLSMAPASPARSSGRSRSGGSNTLRAPPCLARSPSGVWGLIDSAVPSSQGCVVRADIGARPSERSRSSASWRFCGRCSIPSSNNVPLAAWASAPSLVVPWERAAPWAAAPHSSRSSKAGGIVVQSTTSSGIVARRDSL
jgi:hypothetical protein